MGGRRPVREEADVGEVVEEAKNVDADLEGLEAVRSVESWRRLRWQQRRRACHSETQFGEKGHMCSILFNLVSDLIRFRFSGGYFALSQHRVCLIRVERRRHCHSDSSAPNMITK